MKDAGGRGGELMAHRVSRHSKRYLVTAVIQAAQALDAASERQRLQALHRFIRALQRFNGNLIDELSRGGAHT
jgi:hypothetical protein